MTPIPESSQSGKIQKTKPWIRACAFLLLFAPLWALVSFEIFQLTLFYDFAGSGMLVGWLQGSAALPVGVCAWLAVRSSSTRLLAIWVAVVWFCCVAALMFPFGEGSPSFGEKAASYHGSVKIGAQPSVVPRETNNDESSSDDAGGATQLAGASHGSDQDESPNDNAEAGSTQGESLPEFPWPPPAASAFYVLPRSLFDAKATIGQATDAIEAALEQSGYVERSFFIAPTGDVILVTRLERMNDDGSVPKDSERWATGATESMDLTSLLSGLFFADRGHYRIIVFVLGDQPFTQSKQQVSELQAQAWLRAGANALPFKIAAVRYDHGDCTALIYEFLSDGASTRLIDSRLNGKQHLEKSGILAAIEKPN